MIISRTPPKNVIRRIGGLEIAGSAILRQEEVIRRIGGLEIILR